MRTYQLHRKVWLAWGRWWAVQIVAAPEVSLGLHVEPRRPLLDVFLGPVTIALGRHPVLSDPRVAQRHRARGFLLPDDPLFERGPVL